MQLCARRLCVIPFPVPQTFDPFIHFFFIVCVFNAHQSKGDKMKMFTAEFYVRRTDTKSYTIETKKKEQRWRWFCSLFCRCVGHFSFSHLTPFRTELLPLLFFSLIFLVLNANTFPWLKPYLIIADVWKFSACVSFFLHSVNDKFFNFTSNLLLQLSNYLFHTY